MRLSDFGGNRFRLDVRGIDSKEGLSEVLRYATRRTRPLPTYRDAATGLWSKGLVVRPALSCLDVAR
jgi:hypothetical protein